MRRSFLLGLALLLAPALVSAAARAAGGGAGEEFAAGEAAFRQGDNAAAEAHYRRALELDPNHLRALIRLATVVSWDNRLKESIGYFDRALSMDPGSVEVRLGLARTLSWDGEFDRAVEIYEGLRRENPGDREASLGLARALGWAGRHREAREVYLRILSGNPKDLEARNGLAAVLSWEGRLDGALAAYDETLAVDPANKDAMAGRARVLYWQGRTAQAYDALNAALRAHPGDRDALKLDASMREGMAPVLDASAGSVHDTDHNDINTQHAGGTYAPSPGWTTGGSIDRYEARQILGNAGRLHGRLLSPKASATWRITRDLSVSGSAGIDRIEGDRSFTHLSGSAGAEYRLDDRWSFSGLLSRSAFSATAQALVNDVGITSVSATAGFRPLPRLAGRLTVEHDGFTDENQRDLLSAFARYAVPTKRPRFGLSWSLRDLSCDRHGTGYFCPHAYVANVGGLDLSDRIGRRFGWNLIGTLGLQTVKVNSGSGQDTDPVRGYHVAASWDFDAGVTAEAYAGRTNLALAMGSGFASTEAGFRIRWRLGAPGSSAGSKAGSGMGGRK